LASPHPPMLPRHPSFEFVLTVVQIRLARRWASLPPRHPAAVGDFHLEAIGQQGVLDLVGPDRSSRYRDIAVWDGIEGNGRDIRPVKTRTGSVDSARLIGDSGIFCLADREDQPVDGSCGSGPDIRIGDHHRFGSTGIVATPWIRGSVCKSTSQRLGWRLLSLDCSRFSSITACCRWVWRMAVGRMPIPLESGDDDIARRGVKNCRSRYNVGEVVNTISSHPRSITRICPVAA